MTERSCWSFNCSEQRYTCVSELPVIMPNAACNIKSDFISFFFYMTHIHRQYLFACLSLCLYPMGSLIFFLSLQKTPTVKQLHL